MNTLKFDNVLSSTYGVYIAGSGMYEKPERKYDSIEIPGKNGTLAMDRGTYENIDLEFQCVLPQQFQENWDNYIAQLSSKTGYRRIEESLHPNHYRLGIFSGIKKLRPTQTYKGASFRLIFDCMPQRFLKSGEITTTLTSTGTISNPTLYESKPLLKVYGYGNLGVGGTTITIAQHSYSYMYIDCEAQDCYYSATPLNSKVTLSGYDFPTLKAGSNNISLANTITKVEITPRWWEV